MRARTLKPLACCSGVFYSDLMNAATNPTPVEVTLTIDQLNDCSRGTIVYVGPPNASRPFVRTWTGWRPATERGHARPGSDTYPSWQIAEAGATH